MILVHAVEGITKGKYANKMLILLDVLDNFTRLLAEYETVLSPQQEAAVSISTTSVYSKVEDFQGELLASFVKAVSSYREYVGQYSRKAESARWVRMLAAMMQLFLVELLLTLDHNIVPIAVPKNYPWMGQCTRSP